MNDDNERYLMDEKLQEIPRISQLRLEEILSNFANQQNTDKDDDDLIIYVIQEMLSSTHSDRRKPS
jgi:hypothetical protein